MYKLSKLHYNTITLRYTAIDDRIQIVADDDACYSANSKTKQSESRDPSFETVAHSTTTAAAILNIQMLPVNKGWRNISFGAPGVNFYLRLGAIGKSLITLQSLNGRRAVSRQL